MCVWLLFAASCSAIVQLLCVASVSDQPLPDNNGFDIILQNDNHGSRNALDFDRFFVLIIGDRAQLLDNS